MHSRRTIILWLAVILLLAGCGAQASAKDMPKDTPLLTLDGEVILAAEDLQNACIRQEVAAEMGRAQAQSEQEIFERLCEYRICRVLAEEFAQQADWQELEDSYADTLDRLTTQEAVYLFTLMETLAMNEEEFLAFIVGENYDVLSAQQLVEYIAGYYTHYSDPVGIEEAIRENLWEMLSAHELVCAYPGMEGYEPAFSSVLE